MVHKGVITESICDKEIFFVIVYEKVNCKVLSGGGRFISQEHWLDCLFGLILDADLASIDIISNGGIHSRLVDISLGQVSHLFSTSVLTVQVPECSLTKLGGIQTLSPFSNIPFSMVSSSLIPQKWYAIGELLGLFLASH